jgi:hypothetical protein
MDVAVRYLELVLRFARLEPDLVEGYHGPAELPARIAAEPRPAAGDLVEQAAELRTSIASADIAPSRTAWLSAQLNGLETACRWLGGDALTYRELVRRCYGVEPRFVPEADFAAAHERLDARLPGRGDLRDRYQQLVHTQLVAPDLLVRGLAALAAELRRRCKEQFELPPGEEVSFELVQDKDFAANADFSGGLRTRIEINDELPIASYRLLELVSHEAYPGHHTESVCKQAGLIEEEGCIELAVYAYPTAQGLIAEGLAMVALETLLGAEAHTVGASVLEPLGIPYDAATASAALEFEHALLGLRANLAMMLDERAITVDQARAYAREWLLDTDEHIEKVVSSLIARRWTPYESCYPEGLALCRRFVGGEPSRFKRLLRDQLTPADLAASVK